MPGAQGPEDMDPHGPKGPAAAGSVGAPYGLGISGKGIFGVGYGPVGPGPGTVGAGYGPPGGGHDGPEGGKGAGGPGGGPVGGTAGYIPVGAGPKGTVEGVALGGSPDGTEGGALGVFQGLEPGQPCAWADLVLLTEVLAGECSGSASANENSSDIFLAGLERTAESRVDDGPEGPEG